MNKIDITEWVDSESEHLQFRKAVHIILHAIANTEELQATMIMKGGVLLALGYGSQRYTKDIDFSTHIKRTDFNQELFEQMFESSLVISAEKLNYGLDCRVQSVKQQPPREDATFPTIKIKIGYADKSNANALKRLRLKKSPDIVEIDYSLNEQVDEIEFYELDDHNTIRIYTTVELIAEKIRALLQQEVRKREREQDLYDLFTVLDICSLDDEVIKRKILKSLIAKSKARNLDISKESFSSDEIKRRAGSGYCKLVPYVNEQLQDFDVVYNEVEEFYKSLPWEKV